MQKIAKIISRNIIVLALVMLIATGAYLASQLLSKSPDDTQSEFKVIENLDDVEKIAPVPLPKSSEVLTELGDVMIKDTDKFRIMYHAQDESFVVSILAGPIGVVQKEAEFELLKQLNIDEGIACKLNTKVRIAKFVDREKSEQDYPLSFCE